MGDDNPTVTPMSIYPPEAKAPFWIVFFIAVFGVLLVIASVWAAFDSLCTKDAFYLYVVIVAWAVAPPVWFWLEYFGVFFRWGKPEAFDLFKYGQQVAGAIWAGVLAALIAFAASGAADETKKVISHNSCEKMCGPKCKKPDPPPAE